MSDTGAFLPGNAPCTDTAVGIRMENDDRGLTFFRFEDLRVYQKALDYSQWVMEAMMSVPAGIDSFRDNYINAATNIAIQIAEGSARNKNQFVYYLKMAKSSVRECLVFSTLAHKMRLFSNIQEEDSRNELMELTKMIGALIGSLIRSSNYEGEEEDMEPHPVHRNRYDA